MPMATTLKRERPPPEKRSSSPSSACELKSWARAAWLAPGTATLEKSRKMTRIPPVNRILLRSSGSRIALIRASGRFILYLPLRLVGRGGLLDCCRRRGRTLLLTLLTRCPGCFHLCRGCCCSGRFGGRERFRGLGRCAARADLARLAEDLDAATALLDRLAGARAEEMRLD